MSGGALCVNTTRRIRDNIEYRVRLWNYCKTSRVSGVRLASFSTSRSESQAGEMHNLQIYRTSFESLPKYKRRIKRNKDNKTMASKRAADKYTVSLSDLGKQSTHTVVFLLWWCFRLLAEIIRRLELASKQRVGVIARVHAVNKPSR